MVGQQTIIADTSVLINFLVVDKIALLTSLANRSFLITEHVRNEVTAHNADQLARLNLALSSSMLAETVVTAIDELQAFAMLTKNGLGIGESSAIAVAAKRGHAIAIDDRIAIKRIAKLFPNVEVLTTELLTVSLIQESHITIAEADQMKLEWEQNFRFKLPFASFSERLP